MARIGFDVAALHRPHPRGVVRVVSEVTGELERRGRIEVVRLAPEPRAGLLGWRQRELPRLERDLELAGIHSFQSAFPVRGRGLRVQTVHELPWRRGVRENADLAHRLWAWLGPRRADRVLVPSEHVARDLRGRRPGLGRIEVVPHGVGPPFGDEPPAGTLDEALFGRLGLPQRPLVVAPGATRPKKNLPALLHGVARLAGRGGPRLHVVVTGAPTATLRADLGLVSRLGLASHVSTPGELDDDDLAALYRLAVATAVLSLSEGFGLPVLESLACGTPVLVPRGSAQSEVAGEAGFAVDAGDPDSVAEALARAHDEREELRHALSDGVRDRTWSRTAERVEAVWERLLR